MINQPPTPSFEFTLAENTDYTMTIPVLSVVSAADAQKMIDRHRQRVEALQAEIESLKAQLRQSAPEAPKDAP